MKSSVFSGVLFWFMCLSVLAFLCLSPSPEDVGADQIKLSGSRFNKKRAQDGKAFKSKEWRVEGNARWAKRDGTQTKNDFAILLGPSAKLSRDVHFATPPAKKSDKDGFNPEQWVYSISVDGALSPLRKAGKSHGVLVLRLEVPGTSRAFEKKIKVNQIGFRQRALIALPVAKLSNSKWRLSIQSKGKIPILVDDVLVLRLPQDPAVMNFAKPNGKNGPDRLDSGTLGFVSQTAHEHAPLPVVSVRKGSPAAVAGLLPGDIILEINGAPLPINSCKPGFDWFENGHEQALGRASEAALESGRPRVRLTVLRKLQTKELTLKLVKRSPLPEDFPFDDQVTPELYADLMDFVRRTRKKQGYWANGGNEWIQTCFAGLALLGRRDPQDYEAIRQVADWYLEKYATPESFGNLGFWTAAYAGIFMSEYLLATGDERIRPWIESALKWIEKGFHTSKWGMPALGHGPSGLPYGQKALMAPASHVIVFEALARKAGIKSTIWETLLPYMMHSWSDPKDKGHGAMGYNASYRDLGEFWSRSGLFALAAKLRGEKRYMRKALAKIMLERHSYMRNSHAYGNPGDVWGLVGLFSTDPQAFRKVMQAWRWSFGGAWEPKFGLRHTMAHMGSPYMGGEGLVNPSMAMLLSVRQKGLFITGAPDQDKGWLKLKQKTSITKKIRIRRNAQGLVVIEGSPFADRIRYTTDGRRPTVKSQIYQGPFSLPLGGLVSAGFDRGEKKIAAITRVELGLSKHRWKVMSANGAKDKNEAIRRAWALIDGDPETPWQPDMGEGAHRFPFTVTIDLGSRELISGIRFSGRYLPKEVKVAVSNQASGLAKKAKVYVLEGKKAGKAIFDLPQLGRYLRIEVIASRTGKIRYGELDILWPQIISKRDRSAITLNCPVQGLKMRYETGSKIPSKASKELRGSIKLKKGRPLNVCLFDKSGKPVGPIRVFRQLGKK